MLKTMLGAMGILACAGLMAMGGPKVDKPTTTASAAKPAVEQSAWPAETLSGKIMMVDSAKNLLVVKGPHGVPFDLSVTPSTRIESAGHSLTLNDLKSDQKKDVSVRFVPERSGDIARTVQVTG